MERQRAHAPCGVRVAPRVYRPGRRLGLGPEHEPFALVRQWMG